MGTAAGALLTSCTADAGAPPLASGLWPDQWDAGCALLQPLRSIQGLHFSPDSWLSPPAASEHSAGAWAPCPLPGLSKA